MSNTIQKYVAVGAGFISSTILFNALMYCPARKIMDFLWPIEEISEEEQTQVLVRKEYADRIINTSKFHLYSFITVASTAISVGLFQLHMSSLDTDNVWNVYSSSFLLFLGSNITSLNRYDTHVYFKKVYMAKKQKMAQEN